MARKLKAKDGKARPIISLEQKLPEVPGRDPFAPPTQHLVKDDKGGYIVEKYRRPSKTLLVDQIREEVDQWRDKNYQTPAGISPTAQRLLEWWFDETHRFENGEAFQYYFAQREAIETIIYLYEVKGYRDVADMILKYMDPKAYKEDLFTRRKTIEQTVRDERILTRVVPETGLVAQQELPQADHCRFAIKMRPARERRWSWRWPSPGPIFTRS